MTIPNLYEFATKELAQDATIAYILAWADPKYRKSHPQLHALGTELLRSLLCTQEMDIPIIKTLQVKTQDVRIDILVRINVDQNTDRIILIIEDKVSTTEHSNQIERYKEAAEKRYSGSYDHLIAVYLKTGNVSKEELPPKDKCGHFLRHDLIKILNGFQDTKNVIVDDFRTYLQRREERWKDDIRKKGESFVSRAERLGVYDLFASVENMFKQNWPGTRLSSNNSKGLVFRLRQNKTEGFVNYARIDPDEKVRVVFFRHAIRLCVDEFKALIQERPFRIVPAKRENDVLEDLDAALEERLEIQFPLTEDDWETRKGKLYRLTRVVYDAQQSRLQGD
ncbi:MAG: PD-(D/E)XK nuclease family protein [Gemmatimonadetes bacterium]|nr:PD-(D/E)XK nuclease family protein [Gemmatimonadota bacterium]